MFNSTDVNSNWILRTARLTEMLGDLENETRGATGNFETVQNWWKILIELNVDDGTNDGHNLSFRSSCSGGF